MLEAIFLSEEMPIYKLFITCINSASSFYETINHYRKAICSAMHCTWQQTLSFSTKKKQMRPEWVTFWGPGTGAESRVLLLSCRTLVEPLLCFFPLKRFTKKSLEEDLDRLGFDGLVRMSLVHFCPCGQEVCKPRTMTHLWGSCNKKLITSNYPCCMGRFYTILTLKHG